MPVAFARRFSLMLLSSALFGAMAFAATPQPGYPVPQIVGPTNPTAVAPGGPGFTLKVYGANFISASTVNWNKQPRVTTFISAHELDAQILASDIATNTAGMITVTTTSPNGPITSSTYFQVEVHAPTPGIGTLNMTSIHNILEFSQPQLIGDINNDGALDFVGNEGFTGTVVGTALGNGDATFKLGPLVTVSEWPSGGDSELADFDGDGNLDLLYVTGPQKDQNYPLHLKINFGNGDGTFHPGPTFGTFGSKFGPNPGGQLIVGDYNRDGTLDIATPNASGISSRSARQLNIFEGNGDGTFSEGSVVYLGAPSSVVAGDFNGDGILDLMAVVPEPYGGSGTFQLRLLLGNGDGTFQPFRIIETVSGRQLVASKLVLGDFNSDGKLDLAVSDSSGRIGILLGNGDGTFQPTSYYDVGTEYFFQFAAGDFNSDGKTDLLVQQYYSTPTLSILLGNGDGTFQSQQVLTLPGFDTIGLAVGDWNNDGLLDFAYIGSEGYIYTQQ